MLRHFPDECCKSCQYDIEIKRASQKHHMAKSPKEEAEGEGETIDSRAEAE